MASFSRSLLFLLLIVTGPWQVECACIDRSSEAATYGRKLLENQREIWWCLDPTHRFPGGQRVHESVCSEGAGFIDDAQLCSAVVPTATDDNCPTAPWVAPNNTQELTPGDLPQYVKYYVCTTGKAWLSGRPGRFTQCIDGGWTAILDRCDAACDPPRDCSEISQLGFNNSDVYTIVPTGKLADFSVDVYCSLSSEPDSDGWTTVMTVGPQRTDGTITATGGGIASNGPTNKFFIGIQHLSALAWDDTNERPLVFRIALTSQKDGKTFSVTYDDVVIDRSPPYTLSKLGTYHGDGGDALRASVGQAFIMDNQNIWWDVGSGNHIVSGGGTSVDWNTLLEYSQLNLLRIKVRPKDFDMKSSCPPAIGYERDWVDSTRMIIPGERSEGSVISYRCEKPMYMEGPETAKTIEGNVTCQKTNDVLNWDRLPVLPCKLTCPPDFVPNELKTRCLHFSSDPSPAGITSASLFCSRSYNASLGEFAQGEDLASAEENVAYYTSHVSILSTVNPEPNINITCDNNCLTTPELRCLSVSKKPTVFTKTFQRCQDLSTHYTCQLPAKCPPEFSELDGLCYRLIDDYGDLNSFKDAQQRCIDIGSGLAFIESVRALEFVKHLVWVKDVGASYMDTAVQLPATTKVLIGLNNAFGSWNSSYHHQPDPDIVALAKVSTGDKFYSYITVYRNRTEAMRFGLAAYRVNEAGVTMKYAVCQLHGAADCISGPPPATENMILEWDNSTAFNAQAKYKCPRGYFMNESTSITEQTIECRGQLGGWVTPEYERFNCTLVEVCDLTTLPCAASPYMELDVSSDFLTLDSFVEYSCPPGMGMPGSLTSMNVSCTDDSSTTPVTYKFLPTAVSDCNICTQEVNVTNATTTWVKGDSNTVGQKANIQCLDGLLMKTSAGMDYNNVTIDCTYFGWWPDLASLECVPACTGDPPVPGTNMNMTEITARDVGANLTYFCDEGLYIPATFPSTSNETTVSCNATLDWEPSTLLLTDLLCARMCFDNPFSPVSSANTTWDEITRVAGTEVNITCPEGYAFPDLNDTMILTCGDDGNWTEVIPEDVICRRYTLEDPLAPNGTVYDGPSPPHWENSTVNFTCQENLMSKDGLNSTSMTFNGTDWVPLDPDFACFKACGDPMSAVDPVTMNFTEQGVEGDEATYECLGGFEGSDALNVTSVCEDGNWTLGVIPVCKMCSNQLPAIPHQGYIVVRGIHRYGAVVTYKCQSKYFENAETEIDVTCVDGNWRPTEVPPCFPVEVSDTTPGPPTEPPVILPTLPPYDPSYPATSDYYWGTIQNNMTDANEKEDNYATTDGPFGFGYAVSLSSNNEQCMIHESYQVGEENCTRNPKQCADGFSFSVWEKALISEDHFGENASFSESDHKYILSTGGDDAGHPGVALYHKGYWLGAVVSTGDKFWKVEVAGIAPNDTWSNIAVRWEPPTESGEKGLELFVDLKKVGQRIYGTTASPLAPLDPALVMIGCHKTSTDTAYRGYNDAEYDEVAMWKRRLADNETNFFFGGFEANFSDVSADDFNQMINNVDLSDPDQRASAVEILKKITFEEPTPSVAPEPTSSSSTSSSSSTAVHSTASSPTASSATVAPPSDEQMARHTSLVELIEKFTSNTSIPKRINTKTHEGMMDILDSVSNLFLPSSFEKWRELQKEKPGSSKVTADLGNWLMGVSKAIVFNNGSEPYKTTKSTETILTETHKIRAGELKSLKNFYEFPEYKLLPDIRKRWNLPYDRSAVPTNLFEDSRCDSRALNIISTLYDTYDDVAPTRVNRNTMDKYLEYELDSRVMSVRAETDPVLNKYRMIDSKAPPCIPKLGKQNPIRLKFEHKVKQYTMRNLKFHSNETVIEINQRICGWFNPAIGEYGAWDRTGCKMLMTTAEYTKCACEHFGTYAIIAEQVEPREVPDEQLWLTITKYIGYILSFIALIIYIVTILVSGDLKDMFHLIGLNLAVAVFFGSIFMLVSDMDTIRDDRHICAAMGTLIQVFYLGAGAWIFVLGHASFKAITAGVISGRLRAYFFLAWSVPLMSMGLTYLLFFHDLGLDPRCFMSWVNEPKYCFFGPQIFFCAVAFIFGCIVICNMSTPALRKDNLIDDYGSFCYGGAFVMIFFAITWTFGLLAYVRFHFREVDFYPIFQVFNSWMGLIILLFIGFGSRRFRMTLAGQAKARREALFGNAFGTPAVPIEDRQHLGSPVDQRSKSATPSVSGRSSPERASSAGPEFPNKPPSTGMARASSAGQEFPNRPSSMGVVAGRPGSRPNSGF